MKILEPLSNEQLNHLKQVLVDLYDAPKRLHEPYINQLQTLTADNQYDSLQLAIVHWFKQALTSEAKSMLDDQSYLWHDGITKNITHRNYTFTFSYRSQSEQLALLCHDDDSYYVIGYYKIYRSLIDEPMLPESFVNVENATPVSLSDLLFIYETLLCVDSEFLDPLQIKEG